MSNVSDARFDALRGLGYEGSTSDMLLQWLQAGGPGPNTGGGGSTLPLTPTVLDPTFTDPEVTLSGGGLIATHSTSTSWHRSSSDVGHASGKRCFELTANTQGSSGGTGVQISAGFIDSGNRLGSGYIGQFGTSEAGGLWEGTGITNNTFVTSITEGVFQNIGDTIMFSIDYAAGQMYVATNGSQTGISVPTFTPVGTLFAAIGLDGNAASGTMNFGATPFTNSIIPGFGSWDGAQDRSEEIGFDPIWGDPEIPAGIILTNNYMQAENQNANWHKARVTGDPRSTGKLFFEVTAVSAFASGNQMAIGIINALSLTSGYIGQDSQGFGHSQDGYRFENGGFTNVGGAYVNAGDKVKYMFDLDAGTAHVQVNGDAPVQSTTNIVTATEYWPAVSVDGSDGDALINLGATDFAFPLPPGFEDYQPWEQGGSGPTPIPNDAKTIPDAWEAFLTGVVLTPPGSYQRNDWWFQYLREQGYQGSISDMTLAFWRSFSVAPTSGGGFSSGFSSGFNV